jgi:hypothetical protein
VAAIERRDAVDVDRVAGRIERVDERPGLREIRADVHHPAHAQAEEAALAVERELALEVRGAAVVVADDGLEARADPFTGCSSLRAASISAQYSGIGLRADAEAAARRPARGCAPFSAGTPVIATMFGSISDRPWVLV